MKPAPFEYHRAETVDHAVRLLSTLDVEAKVLAGGQSLLPMMNFRLARPEALVDVSALSDGDTIRHSGGRLEIGAFARHADVEESAVVRSACPLVTEAIRHVGHAAIRSRGTLGGSIAHADPAAQWPLLLVALDGQVRIRSARGERVLAAEGFFVDYLVTALEPDELVVSVSIEDASRWTGWGFKQMARRHGDFALVSVVALVAVDGDGCVDARLAIGGADRYPFRSAAAEERLRGQRLDEAALREAAALSAEAANPLDDVNGSAAYRRHLAGVLVERALRQATNLDGRSSQGH